MVRVWASEDRIKQAVTDTVKGYRGKYRLIAQSDPYPCRPPKQKESRVYLEFLPDDGSKNTLDQIIKENDPYAVEID